MKKLLNLFIIILMTFCLFGCGGKEEEKEKIVKVNTDKENIVILYTNDVHSGVDDNIGYATLKHYKEKLKETNKNVTLVDSGDYTQGSYFSAVSKGEKMIEIMNEVGYDIVTLGNHEFDYGMEQLAKNISLFNGKVVCCNVKYIGTGEDYFKNLAHYEIVEYGNTKVAYIGVVTPWSLSESSPQHFMENGEIVYDLGVGENGNKLYNLVQENINECKELGANYVVLLSHLGTDTESDSPYTSVDVVNNTEGVDIVIDAHSHFEIPCLVVKDKNNKDVIISSSGTKLANIGQIVITKEGLITSTIISGVSQEEDEKIESIISEYDGIAYRVIGHSNVLLSIYDSNGIRMVRNRETAIGNFVSDAYRHFGNSDIAFINGGGVRSDINKGDVTYKDIISVNPFGNMLCVINITGQELLDIMEYFYRNTQDIYVKDGNACGEDGSFQQVSGMKLTINTSIPTPIIVDENDMLIGIEGERRVSDVYILEGSEYKPLDVNRTYTLTTTNYVAKNGGSGMGIYLSDNEIVVDEFMPDYQALIDYLEYLNGDLSKYENTDNRITVK